MINFETELDQAGVSRMIRDTVPVVTDTISFRRETRTTEKGKDPATWTWEDLQAYVVKEIQQRFGAFPRDPFREKSIFSSFLTRWGAKAGPIAKYAFERYQGMWKGSPISVQRFCKNSDKYFASVIDQELR